MLSVSGLCSFANSFLTDVNKSTILHLHNRLRRSFANGAQGVIVANMNKLVSFYPHGTVQSKLLLMKTYITDLTNQHIFRFKRSLGRKSIYGFLDIV